MIVFVVSAVIITILVHLLIYAIQNFERKKKEEQNAINNIALILNKLDSFESNGGKMQEETKKLARYLAKKIDDKVDEAKEEILEKLEEMIEMIYEAEPEKEDDEFGESDEENPFDLEDEPPAPEPPRPVPPALDVSKRRMDYVEEEVKKRLKDEVEKEKKEWEKGQKKEKKKGLFGGKK